MTCDTSVYQQPREDAHSFACEGAFAEILHKCVVISVVSAFLYCVGRESVLQIANVRLWGSQAECRQDAHQR